VGSQKEGALAAPCAQYAVLHSEQARRGLGWPCEQQTGSQYVHVPTQQPIRVEGSNDGARLLPPRSARRASLRARACELAARKHIAGKRLSSALTSACEGGQRTDARRMPRATPPQISELLPPPKLGPRGVPGSKNFLRRTCVPGPVRGNYCNVMERFRMHLHSVLYVSDP
jgi:hypothetical protein